MDDPAPPQGVAPFAAFIDSNQDTAGTREVKPGLALSA
jgi:hypothetical protein